jgi:SAM-dependent methyltransferase
MADPTPERILQISTGGWACAALAAGVEHGVFEHLSRGVRTPEALAKAAGISPRGAQAILDALHGLALVRRERDGYVNAEDAAVFLVPGAPAYVGDFALQHLRDFPLWERLPESVRTGKPAQSLQTPENPYWESLVVAIAPLAFPCAKQAVARLDVPLARSLDVLDVGGGAGAWSAVFLGANPRARATQVDWANVNRIARGFVARFGVGDRFATVDGDFHEVDLGQARHDVAVLSHIAHQESPEENVRLFTRLRRALRPGGTLVIADFVLSKDRGGHPFALLFHATMLLNTAEGAAWTEPDYRAWLSEAGFRDVSFETTPTPATLVYAR